MAGKPGEKLSQGWVKLHRKSIKSSAFDNPIYWKVWCWCLMKAAHKAERFPFNQMDLKLLPGQFVTGRKKACLELKITSRRYRSALNYLKATSRVTSKSTNKFTIISVINWKMYQVLEKSDQQNDQPASNQRPTSVQPASTYKKLKNSKNDKEVCVAEPTPHTRTYLQFVQLSDKDHKKLLDRFGQEKTNEWITELNDAIGSKGYKYNSHYFTILAWDRKARREDSNGEETIEQQVERVTRKK